MNYHHGQTIKEFRKKRGMSVAELAKRWPGEPVTPRYVQRVEAGEKQIADQGILRQLSEILDIPLWCFGLSAYNPFNPQALPGHGERMYKETLDLVEDLIEQTWHLRRAAPLAETEKAAERLDRFFQHVATYLSPTPQLEPRFLELYAQAKLMKAVLHIERQQYKEALEACSDMYEIAKQLGEPSLIALSLASIGTELDRAGQHQEAVTRLEEARDASFNASRQIMAFVNAYLARAYASAGDAKRFQRAIDAAQNIAINLGQRYGDGTDLIYHKMSGILAERSYGYLELKQPRKTLDMQDEITRQIDLEHNVWLRTWIPLDWARAYLMLKEIEESVKAALEFHDRASIIQSPHMISRAHDHLITLEEAGYGDVQAVRDLREKIMQHDQENK